jgi:DNA repair protein RadC
MADRPPVGLAGGEVIPEGHRDRMRARLLLRGSETLADYEMLEMLLFLSMPRRDTRALAKSVIRRFGNLHRTLTARAHDLRAAGFDAASIGITGLVREAGRRLTIQEPARRPVLKDAASLDAHLDTTARLLRPRHLAVLLLDSRNRLLGEMDVTPQGDATAVARDVAKKILELGATAMIMASFRAAPSPDEPPDTALTLRIARACQALGVVLHDHLLFEPGGSRLSLRQTGLLPPAMPGFADAAMRPVAAAARGIVTSRRRQPRLRHGLPDTELLGHLLSMLPTSEPARAARRAIRHFGTFAAVLAAPKGKLRKLAGLNVREIAAIKLLHAAALRLARGAILGHSLLDEPEDLIDYLTAKLSRERVERFHILFLDTEGRLLADEAQARGTVNHTPVYPREVVRRAMELGAAQVILVHNHPSGDPLPSQADVEMTALITQAAASLDIGVHDHIIIGFGAWLSFRQAGLL